MRIINAQFYNTLVLVAVLTSLTAGARLEYLLRKGAPLLSAQSLGSTEHSSAHDEIVA